MVGTCPCKDCTKRNATCHSKCKKYNKWRKDYENEMKEAKKRSRRYSDGYYKKLGE